MYSIKRFDWTLHLLAIALCAYFLARAVSTYIGGILESYSASPAAEILSPAPSPPEEKEVSLEDYKLIADRNIFNSAESAAPKEAVQEVNPDQLGELGPAVKTTLSIKVMSTLAIGEGTDRRSSAVVSGEKSKTGVAYYVGDPEGFATNVKLTKVMKDRIEFIHNGRLEYAELEDFASKKSVFASAEEVFGKDTKGLASKDKEKPAEPGGESGKLTLDQKEIDEALQNLDKLYSEVRIVPNFKDGKPSGMKVLSIKPGSLASKLGIRRGDVLTRVNGQELDIKRGMELFNTMKDSRNFSLEVERGGKNQTLEYEIK